MTNQEYAVELRKLADFYDAYPLVPQPSCMKTLTSYNVSKEDLANVARATGAIVKSYTDSYFYLTHKVGAFELNFCCDRARVCKKVVKGTRTVTKRVEVEREPEYEEKEVEEEIVEWECDEPLLTKD